MSAIYRNRSVAEMVAAIKEGRITVEFLTHAVRQELVRYEPNLRAWVEFSDDLDAQIAAVDTSLEDSPLKGISVGIKDIIDVAGLPTRAGSTLLDDAPKISDAACVARLRELGAVIQGKTVTTEFGYFAPGPTVNPFLHSHTPGGSSSGSAAAVGAATIPLTLGTQTAGSLTRPASYCGAAGMVLATGTTSLEGVTGLSESLDTLGLLGQSVADIEFIWRAFTDNPQTNEVIEVSTESTEPPINAFVWEGSGLLPLSPQMSGLIQLLPEILTALGHAPRRLDWVDHVLTLSEDHRTIMAFEAALTMDVIMNGKEGGISPQLSELVDTGHQIDEVLVEQAHMRTKRSSQAIHKMLGDSGVIIGPAASGPAPEGLSSTGSPDLSRPWQVLGLPVVVVPGARTSSGLPLGIQIIGLPGHEDTIFQLARELEPILRGLPALDDANPNPGFKDLSW